MQFCGSGPRFLQATLFVKEQVWDQFLTPDRGALRWADCVTIAGSSHGSTTAARFATHTEVARVCLFCGPNARGQEIGPADLQSATPTDRFFVFGHTEDDTGPDALPSCAGWAPCSGRSSTTT